MPSKTLGLSEACILFAILIALLLIVVPMWIEEFKDKK